MENNIVNIIQAMLAPGIMISACGLLLLGMNNKYSMVVNRIRVLDEEKRKLHQLKKTTQFADEEKNRQDSLSLQIKKLNFRMKLIRNAVVGYSVAVAFFLITCISIGLQYLINSDLVVHIFILFFTGMLSVFFGILHAIKEVYKGYEIMQIEIEYTEKNNK